MLELHPMSIGDLSEYRRYLSAAQTRNSTHSVGISFLWNFADGRNLVLTNGMLSVEYLTWEELPFFAFPIGKGDLRAALEDLISISKEQNIPLILDYFDESERQALENAMPGAFSVEETRSTFDYLYDAHSLATLSGKRMHGKRNFCNRFEAAYDWHTEPLTPDNMDDCRSVFGEWAENKSVNEEERAAVENAFLWWDRLDMLGTVLYANGRCCAFSFGELLRRDTFVEHFEKAVEDMPGAFPMICREMSRRALETHPDIRYVNREEDMGLPNLRKAKEDWKPIELLAKYKARYLG